MAQSKVLKKYKEIVLLPELWFNGRTYNKGETVRTVMLSKQVADFNNKHPNLTGCKYELLDENKEERLELIAKARELKVKFANNISTDKLKVKVKEGKIHEYIRPQHCFISDDEWEHALGYCWAFALNQDKGENPFKECYKCLCNYK